MLTTEQKRILNIIESGKNVFVTGMAGTGKTHVINTFRELYKNKKKIGVTSTTGISAILINGTTLHSFLGIGLGKADVATLYSKILKKKFLRDRWCNLDILVIDEVSMLLPELFDKIEELGRMLRQCHKPFGGIQLILTGDMLQLPPVKCDKFCFEAESWVKCIDETVYLTENLRQNDEVFQKCLSEIRLGSLSEENARLILSRENIKLENEHGIIPTKICSLNSEVDRINYKELDNLEDDIYEYEMEVDSSIAPYLVDKIKKNCNMNEVLQICVGAQVMLLSNLDIDNGLVNGSRGIVTCFVEEIPKVRFLNGVEVLIDYHTIDIEENDEIICSITQIPLRVAYAVSAHKIQGHTLDYCDIDFDNFFADGQAYVALSRVRSIDCLSVRNFKAHCVKANHKAIKFYNMLIDHD